MNKKNKFLAVLTTAALTSSLFAPIAQAADGDIFNKDKTMFMSKTEYLSNMKKYKSLALKMATKPNELGYEYNGKIYTVSDILNMAATLPAGADLFQAIGTQLTPWVTEIKVVSVNAINDINAAYGTAKEALVLPAKVTLNLSNNTTAEADVTWACDNYDGNKAGEYTFTGTYSLPQGVTGNVVPVSVKVIVAADPTAQDKEAAAAVDTKIAALPAVDALTLENEAAVVEARTAYDALTEAGKTFVTKLEVLTAAEAKIAQLKADKTYAELKAAVEVKVVAYETLANGDLSTQVLIDAAKAAKAAITLEGLKDEDKTAFNTRVAAADAKVAAAEVAIAKPAVESISVVSKTSINVTLKTAKADAKVADFEVKVGETAVSVTAVKANTDNTVYTLTVALNNLEGKVAVNGIESAAFDYKAPEIQSATQVGSDVVEVVYSENVDAVYAQIKANYAIVKTGTAKVLAIDSISIVDAKTVRVKLNAATLPEKGANYTLSVQNMRDKASTPNVMSGVVNASFVGITDTAKATVLTAVAVDANKIQVTMNKEIKTAPTAITVGLVNADGTMDTAKVAAVDTSKTTVEGNIITITLFSNNVDKLFENGKTYRVRINGTGLDMYGNTIADNQTADFAGLRDTQAPTVSGYEYKAGKLTVTFSEAMDDTQIGTAANYRIFNPNTGVTLAGGASGNAITATPNDDNTAVTLSFANALPDSTELTLIMSGYVEDVKDGLKDAAVTPNGLADNAKVVFTTPDPVAAKTTVTSAAVGDDATLGCTVDVVFNQKVNQAEAENITNYAIAKVSDATKTLAVTKAELNEDGKTVTLYTSEQTEGTTYKVAVTGLTNIDAEHSSTTFIGNDLVAPTLVSAKAINDKIIELTFDQSLNVIGAQAHLSAMVVKKGTAITVPLSAVGTWIISGKTVRINLAANAALADGVEYVITVSGAADAQNNYQTNTDPQQVAEYTQEFVGLEDTTSPQIVSVTAVNEGKIIVTFNEELGNAAVEALNAAFTLTEEGKTTPVVAFTALTTAWGKDSNGNDDHTKVEISRNTAFLENDKNYTLTVNNTVKDLNENTVDATTKSSITFAGIKDENKPQLVSAELKDSEDGSYVLTLKFNEEISIAGGNGDYTVTDVETGTLNPVANVAIGEDKTTVELTLTNPTEAEKQYRVYINGYTHIKDTALGGGNSVDSKYAIATFTGKDLTTPAYVANSAKLINNTTLKLTFDEEINSTSVEAADFVVKNDGVNVKVSDAKVDTDGQTIVLTIAALKNGSYADTSKETAAKLSIAIADGKDITDMVGNKLEAGELVAAGTVADKAKPVIVSYKLTAPGTITLTFSENIATVNQTDAAKLAKVLEVGDNTVTAVTADGTSNVIITLGTSVTTAPSVIFKTPAAADQFIKDTADDPATAEIDESNKFAGGVSIIATDKVAPVISGITFTAGTATISNVADENGVYTITLSADVPDTLNSTTVTGGTLSENCTITVSGATNENYNITTPIQITTGMTFAQLLAAYGAATGNDIKKATFTANPNAIITIKDAAGNERKYMIVVAE